MTQHFLRLKWMPSDEGELLAAFNGGLLEEKNWCDLKRELGPGKGANAELARDLASFAVDGGTLIIGLDEKCAGGSPLTPVDLSAVTRERIESVAAMKVDPPLTVECSTVDAASSEGGGYVLVHVPESPLAPHQVEGRYLGRGDATKRYLSDAEVAALMGRRQQSSDITIKVLQDFVRSDPFSDSRTRAHLFLVARPVTHRTEILRPLIDDEHRFKTAIGMLQEIQSREEIQALRPPQEFRLAPDVLGHSARTPDGFKLGPDELNPESGQRERWAAELEFCEDGKVRFYDACASSQNVRQGVERIKVLYIDQVMTTCRQFLGLAAELSGRYGFVGTWHLGVALTGLRGTLTAPTSFAPINEETYTRDVYDHTTGASVRELESSPGRVTERLLRPLYRGYASGTHAAFHDRP